MTANGSISILLYYRCVCAILEKIESSRISRGEIRDWAFTNSNLQSSVKVQVHSCA